MLPPDYTYYLLKFAEKDYYPLTKVEMVYYKLATMAGITMMPSELISIDGDEHFLTERYNRKDGKKIHTQTPSPSTTSSKRRTLPSKTFIGRRWGMAPCVLKPS